ncbi:MAG: PilT/PilU family type 4a pilus ATPase [Myxococcota bacterium]|nr:PilT/PilU family type 4a pilus ATPase [Myxococcota bacterium]
MTNHSSGESSPNIKAVVAAGVTRTLTIDALLDHMLRVNASDLYLTADKPPVFRVNGAGLAAKVPLSAEQVERLVLSLLAEEQQVELARELELNFAIARGDGRFRINVFRQRGAIGMVARLVRTTIKTLDELGLPPVMKTLAMSKRGLLLVVGATGSGKSTLLAGVIDHRNANEAGHILTIEDPVEFTHAHKMSIVTQREVGTDTRSYEAALKNALRQAPDVVLIGEVRDAETMEAAVAFAETGHLCISTLHANNANQAVERILNFFPQTRQHEIRLQLALNLRAIVAQRLVPSTSGGRSAALEIMLDTPRVKDLIKKGEIEQIKDAMVQSATEGCRTFDQSLFELYSASKIGEAEALQFADSPNNLRMLIDRHRATGGAAARKEPVLRLAEVWTPPGKTG